MQAPLLYLGLLSLDRIGLAFAYLQAVVPCYDVARQNDYDNACRAINSLGASDSWKTSPYPLFSCIGNDPGYYYMTLVDAGLGTCVCGYSSVDGENWSFTGTYGTCNNVCTLGSFTCDGTNPIPSQGSGAGTSSSSSALAPITSSTSFYATSAPTRSTSTAPAIVSSANAQTSASGSSMATTSIATSSSAASSSTQSNVHSSSGVACLPDPGALIITVMLLLSYSLV